MSSPTARLRSFHGIRPRRPRRRLRTHHIAHQQQPQPNQDNSPHPLAQPNPSLRTPRSRVDHHANRDASRHGRDANSPRSFHPPSRPKLDFERVQNEANTRLQQIAAELVVVIPGSRMVDWSALTPGVLSLAILNDRSRNPPVGFSLTANRQ